MGLPLTVGDGASIAPRTLAPAPATHRPRSPFGSVGQSHSFFRIAKGGVRPARRGGAARRRRRSWGARGRGRAGWERNGGEKKSRAPERVRESHAPFGGGRERSRQKKEKKGETRAEANVALAAKRGEGGREKRRRREARRERGKTGATGEGIRSAGKRRGKDVAEIREGGRRERGREEGARCVHAHRNTREDAGVCRCMQKHARVLLCV